MPLLLMLIICCSAEAVNVYNLYKAWVKKGGIVDFIPKWKDTKKPFYWFLGWNIAKCVTDVIIIVIFILAIPMNKSELFVFMVPIWFAAYFFQMIFYVICEAIVIKRIGRKNAQPIKETNTTNDVIENAEDNSTGDEQNDNI